MTNHSTNNSDEARPIASIARRTAGLIGAVVLSGLLVASCGSNVTELGATAIALSRAEVKTEAVVPSKHQRFEHVVVNQRSTGHDSDLPGASIAAYGQ
jgi:hypothetical protein